jgi:hypothetical protein
LGFDLDAAVFSGGVVASTAPGPVLRLGTQPALDGILVDIVQFLLELPIVADIAVIATYLGSPARAGFARAGAKQSGARGGRDAADRLLLEIFRD